MVEGKRPSSGPFRGRAQGRAQGRRNGTRTWGGVYQKQRGGVYHHRTAHHAGFVRVFGPRPTDPNRASGEGLYGSDPPFLTAGAVSRGGGCTTRCTTGCTTPPRLRGGRSRRIYPCGKAPPTACGRDDDERHIRQTDEHKPSGCRALFVWNREELSPMIPGRKVPFRP